MMPAMAVVSAKLRGRPVGALRMRTFVVAPRAPRPAPRHRLLLRHLPADGADPALVHPAGVVRLRRGGSRDLPPPGARRDGARLRRRGQGPGAAGRRPDAGGRLRRRCRCGPRLAGAARGRCAAGRGRPLHRGPPGVPGRLRRPGARDGLLVPDRAARRHARRRRRRRVARAGAARSAATCCSSSVRATRTRRRRRARRSVAAWRASRRSRGLEFDAEHAFGRDVGPRFDPPATDEAFAADRRSLPAGRSPRAERAGGTSGRRKPSAHGSRTSLPRTCPPWLMR